MDVTLVSSWDGQDGSWSVERSSPSPEPSRCIQCTRLTSTAGCSSYKNYTSALYEHAGVLSRVDAGVLIYYIYIIYIYKRGRNSHALCMKRA